MTKLISRKKIGKTKKVIASELTKMQNVFFDEDVLQSYIDNKEEYLYWEMFDFVNGPTIDKKIYNKIIGLNHTNIQTFTDKLSIKLLEILNYIGSVELVIISHIKLDFFGNTDTGFAPLANSYEKFEKKVGNSSYKEAFQVPLSDLADFIEILFWMIRCDPSIAEYIFIFDRDEKIKFFVCKYGNIHLTELGNEQLTKEVLNSLSWEIIEGQEFDNFTEDGKINGREIRI